MRPPACGCRRVTGARKGLSRVLPSILPKKRRRISSRSTRGHAPTMSRAATRRPLGPPSYAVRWLGREGVASSFSILYVRQLPAGNPGILVTGREVRDREAPRLAEALRLHPHKIRLTRQPHHVNLHRTPPARFRSSPRAPHIQGHQMRFEQALHSELWPYDAPRPVRLRGLSTSIIE